MKKLVNYLKDNILIIIFTLLESFLQVYGYLLSNDKSIANFNGKYILIFIILFLILYLINNIYFKVLMIKYNKDKKDKKFSKKRFFIIWGIIFALWIPILLAYYPGIWSYDVIRQTPHINNTEMNSFQPLLHTLIIEFFLIIGKKISSYELGVFLLSIFQSLIMSSIFAYSIEKINITIENKKLSYIFFTLSIIYFGIVPFNSIMAISTTKDVLFSGFLLLLIIWTYDIINFEKINKRKKCIFIFVSILFMLIKNNAVNIYGIYSILLILFSKKDTKRLFTKICCCSLFIYFFLYLGLVIIFKPVKGNYNEKYSIQMQNMSYVAIKHFEDIQHFYPFNNECVRNNYKEYYEKNNVDQTKILFLSCFNNTIDNSMESFNNKKFINNWIKYGIKYPTDYFDSGGNLYIGSWYLNDTSHSYSIYDFKSYLTTIIFWGKLNIEYNSKIPWLKDKYELVAQGDFQYKKYPFFRYIFEPASYILSFFLMIIFLLKSDRKKDIIPLTPLIIIYFSILTGPCIIVRYIYPYMVIVPLLFFRIISNNKREAN